MTLREIAAEAGVSISTVSRVINQNTKSPVSKEVQERILEIAKRTNYVPRHSKKASAESPEPSSEEPLRSIACLFARVPVGESDYFFSTLAKSIEEEAFRHNYVLKYTFSAFDIDDPFTLQLIATNEIDGIAVLGRCDKHLLKFLKKHFQYVVYSGLNNLDAKYDQIICDGRQISHDVVTRLLEQGHRKIAYIGETQSEDRYVGYCSALEEAHISLDESYIANITHSTEEGYKGACSLLDAGCDATAFFCADDITAIGVMRAIKDHGLRIPKDISVASIDDIEMAQFLTPTLTTTHIPLDEMGQMAAKVLIDRIEGGHEKHLKVLFPYDIIERDSTAAPALHHTTQNKVR
ncbi:LacI family DNA-binding transcriptional regulator [Blautia sp. MSJ-19]|uniref:LacI family DNA-binding transcriptional regulator n=1 Tax=Blautia sp. MSJ-19 TaxID=2841517 RepID=UPI001C0F22F1|nr:LacI family DNA-binding transcriptional regulator [Blautia sp. MSJ-19]MBU5479790.1 LacI family DNA-binding transcriptional regulator [Blautia sp. MSJ-19]